MQEGYFELIIEIAPIYSSKVIASLRDFLVMGVSRKEACLRNDVSPAYFSVALKRFKHTEDLIYKINSDYCMMPDESWDVRRVDAKKKRI
ncbi:transcriptional regulator [Escherichia sp. E2586]|uniref:PapB/FocB family fimbrial expression transcriptional regulator n=1 Tax=Escherichia sp. E2586 TaxID=2044457 RepID=UPI0010822E5B|nr:PapB/FocB family fimbrial expression transcriptional regulator [Escherichia sp. E2586]TGC04053.1 transcriptional regulator [Escherichia sp. E2586]